MKCNAVRATLGAFVATWWRIESNLPLLLWGCFVELGGTRTKSQICAHFNAATERFNHEHEARAFHSPPYETLCLYCSRLL